MTLSYTPIEDIPQIVNHLQKSYRSNRNTSIQFRLNQLRSLYFHLKDNEDLIIKALQKDLNKSKEDIILLDLAPIYSDLLHTIKNLSKWSKPKSAVDVSLLFKFSSPGYEYIPLGVILIISPFNFPLNLAIQPLIGSIAAGNYSLLKQSELTPNTSEILSSILIDAIDPKIFQIVNGGINETTYLLNEKFDKIIYTGSGNVGKIIAKKAAETLTPIILELGGKSPAIITPSVKNHLWTVCKRIAFTRFTNAGQICVATDYTLVHESLYDEFIKTMEKVINKYYNLTKENSTRIINDKAFERLMGLIKNTKGNIIIGGDGDKLTRFIKPTIISNVEFNDVTMKEEIFGPILPILKYKNLQNGIENIIKFADTPLALYIYSNNKFEQNLISSQIRSGSIIINEGMIHVGIPNIPFGGIGSSGYGSYHGKWSFKAFSHERAIMKQPFWIETLFEAKYPPISKMDLNISKFFMIPTPTFGRSGVIRTHNYEFLIGVIIIGIIGIWFGYYYS